MGFGAASRQQNGVREARFLCGRTIFKSAAPRPDPQVTRRADFCRRVTLYTREIRRGGRKDTRLGPKLYILLASSFVTCSGYMCSFGLRLFPPTHVIMLKPMVATGEKVIEQRKIVGEGKVRHECWNMTFSQILESLHSGPCQVTSEGAGRRKNVRF